MKQFIRYERRFKKEYGYRITPYKDETTKKWKQRKEYLGVVVDKENGIFATPLKDRLLRKEESAEAVLPMTSAAGETAVAIRRQQAVLDYGDSYFLNELFKMTTIFALFSEFFGAMTDSVLALLFYRILDGGAMMYAESWFTGNYANLLFPLATMKSQRISDVLTYLSDDQLQQSFFRQYLSVIGKNTKGIIIDSTGLPNQVDMPITAWGHHGGGVEMEARLIYAIDQDTGLPLAFRCISGSIPDVSTLVVTVKTMIRLGVNVDSVLIDAGYTSETDICALYDAHIDFCTRLSANFNLYKEIIRNNDDIESFQYAVKCDERAYYVKESEVTFYGQTVFAYLVCDPIERGREVSKTIFKAKDGETPDLSNCGKFILISTKKVKTTEIVPLYHSRQQIERLFGIAKSDLEILPIRVHSEKNFSGFMFLSFLALSLYTQIKSKICARTPELAFRILRNLKCDIDNDNDNALPRELTKKQKAILKDSAVLVPKVSGI